MYLDSWITGEKFYVTNITAFRQEFIIFWLLNYLLCLERINCVVYVAPCLNDLLAWSVVQVACDIAYCRRVKSLPLGCHLSEIKNVKHSWDDTGTCRACSWKRKTCWSYIFSAMVVNALVMQGARASPLMIMPYFSWTILISAAGGLNTLWQLYGG